MRDCLLACQMYLLYMRVLEPCGSASSLHSHEALGHGIGHENVTMRVHGAVKLKVTSRHEGARESDTPRLHRFRSRPPSLDQSHTTQTCGSRGSIRSCFGECLCVCPTAGTWHGCTPSTVSTPSGIPPAGYTLYAASYSTICFRMGTSAVDIDAETFSINKLYSSVAYEKQPQHDEGM